MSNNANRYNPGMVYQLTMEPHGFCSLPATGASWYVVQGSGRILLRANNSAQKTYYRGTGERFPEGVTFERLEVTNDNDFTNYLEIWCGFGEYLDHRIDSETRQAATALETSVHTIPAGSYVDLAPQVSLENPYIRRQSLAVSNQSPTLSLVIGNTDTTPEAHLRGIVLPGADTFSLPTSGTVRVLNNNGEPVSIGVLENYYLK